MAILAQLVDDVIVHKFDIPKEGLSMGRHPENMVVIEDTAVSGEHAEINVSPNEHFPQFLEYYIEDKSSTNGTYVNDARLSKAIRLRNNDLIRLAWNTFKFVDSHEADLEKTIQMLRETQNL